MLDWVTPPLPCLGSLAPFGDSEQKWALWQDAQPGRPRGALTLRNVPSTEAELRFSSFVTEIRNRASTCGKTGIYY